jgi:hypothetical protein
MSMMTLKCPKCGAEAKLSLADTSYSGPRRCWKCHEFFTITIYNNKVTSCEPLSKEEYERQQDAKKAAEKSGGGINFARQAQLEFPQTSSEKPQGGTDSSKQEDTDIFKILAGKSKGGIDFSSRQATDMPQNPVEKPRSGIDFSRREEPQIPPKPPERRKNYPKPISPKEPLSQTEPKKPGSIFPPDRIQTFVPQEDIKEEPEKPQKPKTPPKQRWNSFIPPAT